MPKINFFDIILIVVKVYYSDISNCQFDQREVDNFHMLRKDYVNKIVDPERKRQSALVWMLLQKALAEINVSGNFSVDSKGKWRILEGGAKFSMACSNNIIAVAVGNTEYVGVDVEMISDKVLILKKKLGDIKPTNMSNIEHITREWTRKESAFKAGKKCDFVSRKIYDKIGQEYFLTLCTKDKLEEFHYIDFKTLYKYN